MRRGQEKADCNLYNQTMELQFLVVNINECVIWFCLSGNAKVWNFKAGLCQAYTGKTVSNTDEFFSFLLRTNFF